MKLKQDVNLSIFSDPATSFERMGSISGTLFGTCVEPCTLSDDATSAARSAVNTMAAGYGSATSKWK